MSVTAQVANIARASLHDGPGVRTVIYLKGCGLRCKWCHNPETLAVQSEILYAPIKCIHCGKCIEICPSQHKIDGDQMQFVREGCKSCARCAEACPAEALTLCGNTMTVDDVMREIRKDSHYYAQSGGGCTLSGGECLLQADFCASLLQACKEEGIHTMIETALFVPWSQIEKVLPYCDAFFTDFKIANPQKHKQYTGQDNKLILQNLQKLLNAFPGNITIRIPLIPGVNDTSSDIADFANALSPFSATLENIEVLRYNSLAESKYAQSGKSYTNFGKPQTDEALLGYCRDLKAALNDQVNVFCVL